MKAFTQLCAVLAMMSAIEVSEQQNLISPCPKVFSYDQVGSTWVGRVELPTTNIEKVLELEVVLSLKRPLPSLFRGFITLNDPLITVFQNIINGRNITYQLNFPLKVEIPSVVSITFNGQIYCEGVKPKTYATIIRLKHNMQLTSGDEVTTSKPSTARAPSRRTSRPRTTGGTTRRPDTRGISKRPVTTVSPHYDLDEMYSGIFENMGQENMMRPNKRPITHETSKRPETTVSPHQDLYGMYSGIFVNMEQEKVRPNQKRHTVIHNVNNKPKDEPLVYSDYLIEKPNGQHEKQDKHAEVSKESADIENYDENDPVKPSGQGQSEEDETFKDEKDSEKLKGFLDIRMSL